MSTPDARTRANSVSPHHPQPSPALTGEGTTKRCTKCSRDKARRHFHADRRSPDGLYYRCKQCRRPIQARASKRIAARKRARQAAYQAEFREEITAKHRQAYWADVETARALVRERNSRLRAKRREAKDDDRPLHQQCTYTKATNRRKPVTAAPWHRPLDRWFEGDTPVLALPVPRSTGTGHGAHY